MLTHVRIENFKSWQSAPIKLGPLTAFFGANSSGKSSIIQFLLLLKQTKDSADRTITLDFGGPESDVDLGSFIDAVHNHDEASSLVWDIAWRMQNDLRIADPSTKRSEVLFSGRDIEIMASVSLRHGLPSADYLRYCFGGAKFEIGRERDKGFRLSAEHFKFVRTPGRAWELPSPTKSYAFPDQARTYFQNSQFLSDFENAYVEQMNSILHLGPLRIPPERQYVWAGSSPIDVGERGERTIDAILAATARGEKRNLRYRSPLQPFQAMIAFWLKRMKLVNSFDVAEIADGSGLFRARVKRDAESPEALITDVGFGISQVLPALVLLYYAPEGSTVILEQPEIHLHPAVQSALADLIITTIKTRRLQVILESHSEHLLQRLLRRIAEGNDSPYPSISPDEVSLYFTRMDHGVSKLESLNINLFGGVENWPDDFFGDEFGDITAREEAALKRRMTLKSA